MPTGSGWATAVGLVVLGVLGYVGYENLRPYTPREVAARLLAAPTTTAGKAYCTTRLHPALDAMAAADALDPSDEKDDSVITHDGPGGPDRHSVWSRGTFADPETGRRVPVETRLDLVRSGGWKVNDIVFLAVDGQALEPAVSVAQNYRQLFPPPQAGRRAPDTPAGSGTAGKVGLLGLLAAVKSGGAKAVGLAVLAVAGGVWAAVRRSARPAK